MLFVITAGHAAAFLGIIAGVGLIVWLAMTLWEMDPAAPGMAAFVLGGVGLVYKAGSGFIDFLMDRLKEGDIEQEGGGYEQSPSGA